MCGKAVGHATINGPQGTFKVARDGYFSLMYNQENPDDLSVNGQFDNNELHEVDMTLGGGGGAQPDQISYKSDGTLTVNGKPCTSNTVTANGTKITFNGGKVNITSPDGDTFSMYQTKCNPPAINIEGQVASNRPQGEVAGLVGTFDDSIPEGTHNMFNGTQTQLTNATYWMSWAMDQVTKDAKSEAERRKELNATPQGQAMLAGENQMAAERAAERGAIAKGDTSAAGGADFTPAPAAAAAPAPISVGTALH